MTLTLANVLAKKVYQEVLYFSSGTFLKSEGTMKTILENPKADQNILFSKPLILTT